MKVIRDVAGFSPPPTYDLRIHRAGIRANIKSRARSVHSRYSRALFANGRLLDCSDAEARNLKFEGSERDETRRARSDTIRRRDLMPALASIIHLGCGRFDLASSKLTRTPLPVPFHENGGLMGVPRDIEILTTRTFESCNRESRIDSCRETIAPVRPAVSCFRVNRQTGSVFI